MFCTHNEIDLHPYIVSIDGADWVVVRCKVCKELLGDKTRLVDLVDEAIRRNKKQAKKLELPGRED
jgi:hypothetical protein